MTASVDAYTSLLSELLLRRELEGGDLEDDMELSYVERLDDIWRQLTVSEREKIEAEHGAAPTPQAAEDLGLVDCEESSPIHRREAA